MADYPPIDRSYVVSYAANDRDYPVIGIKRDPRTAGYKVPEDLSPHPDSKRYPNHVFTGAQPSAGDQIVTHIYEILPAPWVPFTRYDDDLGPIQGRRRAVKNEGQQADLAADKKISYEGRDGSSIVSNEIEETWSIKTDEDGNSLFPIRDRDFYDASRGAVQERRQLFVPTGEEEGTLENINGVITQTSYEAYNEFLSVKIVQTYKVNGPQLIGRATDNEGQLVTVTTQRKGALNYVPPSPTATRTVEVNREDAESLIERIIDTPSIFTAQTFSIERPDPIPQKFRVLIPTETKQETLAGLALMPELKSGEISKSEQQTTKFLKRISTSLRDQTVLPKSLFQKATDNDRQEVTITETIQFGDTNKTPTATTTVESEALGDGNFIIRTTEVPEVFGNEIYRKTKEDITPQKFKAKQEDFTFEQSIAGIASSNIDLGVGEFAKSEQQVNKFVKRVSTTSRDITKVSELKENVLTPEGLLATRTLTLSSGDQLILPSAKLIDANIEALGDGRTIKTEVIVDKVFDQRTVSKQIAAQIPAKFITEEIEEDSLVEEFGPEEEFKPEELDENNDGFGVVQSSIQRVTEFTARKGKTIRNGDKEIVEKQSNNNLQIVTITSEITDSPEPEALSAKIFSSKTQAIGGNKYLKETEKVDEVFDNKIISVSKADPIPEKFKVNSPTKKEEKIIEKTQTEEIDGYELGEKELLKSEQRLTEFTVQKTIVKREEDFNEVKSKRLEENWGINIPFKEYISDEIPDGETFEGEGLSDTRHIVREYDKTQLEQNLSAFNVQIPTSIDLDLPRVLEDIEVTWEESKSETESSTNVPDIMGGFNSLTQQDDGLLSSTLSVVPKIEVKFKDIWGKNLPAKIHLFFLKKEDLKDSEIRSKVGADENWPTFKPKSTIKTIYGKSETKELQVYVSRAMQVNDTTFGYGYQPSDGFRQKSEVKLIPVSINIPPCISSSFDIDEEKEIEFTNKEIELKYQQIFITTTNGTIPLPEVLIKRKLEHKLKVEVSINIDETTPKEIPTTGTYVISSSAEPYKFGWFLVRAVTLDAKIFS
jgi:hypothetical protein